LPLSPENLNLLLPIPLPKCKFTLPFSSFLENFRTFANLPHSLEAKKTKPALGLLTKTTATNDVWNKTAYTTVRTPPFSFHNLNLLSLNGNNSFVPAFTKTILLTSNQIELGLFRVLIMLYREFTTGDIVNPEAGDRLFNMRRTQISEYGNALFNSEALFIVIFEANLL